MNKKLGYIGLGKMGFNMTTLLVEKGYELVVSDVNKDVVKEVAERSGTEGADSLKDMVEKLDGPRLIWIMVPHKFVGDVLDELVPLLSEGDTVIDGGNSPFVDTVQRGKDLSEKGIHYIDAGVSGGKEGARGGACIMIGGSKEKFDEYEALFKDLAAPDSYKYMGPSGAGHYVKMIHNGIEYGMMQAIAEGFHLLKEAPDFDINLVDAADIYSHNSIITSNLVSWLKTGFEEFGTELDEVIGSAGSNGEGAWTVKLAHQLGIPDEVIHESLNARAVSQMAPNYQAKLIMVMRNQFGGHDIKDPKMIT